jgi:hypothetical protein
MTTRDPLEQFRRKEAPPPQAAPATGKPPYEAYKAQDRKPERLEIRRVLGEGHAPSYRYLMDIAFNGSFGTEIVLIYSFMVVKIRGKNLQPVIYALLESRCDFIQDYHPDEFMPWRDMDAPLIETIEIVTGRGDKE